MEGRGDDDCFEQLRAACRLCCSQGDGDIGEGKLGVLAVEGGGGESEGSGREGALLPVDQKDLIDPELQLVADTDEPCAVVFPLTNGVGAGRRLFPLALAADAQPGAVVAVCAQAGGEECPGAVVAAEEGVPVVVGAAVEPGLRLDNDVAGCGGCIGFGAVGGCGQVAHQQQAIFHAHLAVVVAAGLPAPAGDAELFLRQRLSSCAPRFGGGGGWRIEPQVSKFGDSLLFGGEIGGDPEDDADLARVGQRVVGPFADIPGVDEDAEVGAEGFDAQAAKVCEIAQTGGQPTALQRLQILAAFDQQPELDLAALWLDADMVVVPFLAVWGAQVAATQQQPGSFGPVRRNAQIDFEIEIGSTHGAVFGRNLFVGCV